MAKGVTVWFTGLSGAGKTTLAKRVEAILRGRGVPVERLDGDIVRQGLCRDLGFSKEDRDRNIERVTFVAKLLTRNGVIVLAAFISPYRAMREAARREIGSFLEVYVRASLDTLLERDVKGLYRRAMAGEIPNFTGISDPYEEPANPDLICDTDRESVEESAAKVLALLEERGFLPARAGAAPDRQGDLQVGVRAGQVSARAGEGRTAPPGVRPAWPGTGNPGAGENPGSHASVPGPSIPHGGVLVNRELQGEAREEALARSASLPRVILDERELSDLELIGNGALSPLTGFMGRMDYECVVESMRLADGLAWSMPVTLAVDEEEAAAIREGQEIALADAGGRVVGVMQVFEKYPYDREREARAVYGTTDTAHPGVARLYRQGGVLLGGPVWVVGRPGQDGFSRYRLSPLETRRIFAERGWRSVVAFQTRNPVHRAHEYLQKAALEIVDGLLLHPLVGATKADDIPAHVRLQTYEALLARYYPPERVVLAVFPAAMRYAGPREAVFHAICRKNYGCTHFIVGRDHAGVGHYYGTYDAQRIFDQFAPGELDIVPLKFEHAFFCRACGNMATAKTCPHPREDHVVLSGTAVREMLRRGESPPPEFTRAEVARILIRAAQGEQ